MYTAVTAINFTSLLLMECETEIVCYNNKKKYIQFLSLTLTGAPKTLEFPIRGLVLLSRRPLDHTGVHAKELSPETLR